MINLADALAVEIPLETVAVTQLVSGAPSTGTVALGVFAGKVYGVWEMTPGAMSDVEADELFIVLGGSATVECLDDGTTIELRARSVGLLTAGMRTVWTVVETIRKVWIAPAD